MAMNRSSSICAVSGETQVKNKTDLKCKVVAIRRLMTTTDQT